MARFVLAREPFEGSDWGSKRRSARARAAVAERAREQRSRLRQAAAVRRRRRIALGAAGAAALLLGGAAAVLASGVTESEPEAGKIVSTGLPDHARELRAAERNRVRQELEAPVVLGVKRSILDAIAECESGGNHLAVSPGGDYLGKYQFDRGTWTRMGGTGSPAKAPELEQDYRAAELYKAAGPSPWPNCGL